jgi:hypothetical protein
MKIGILSSGNENFALRPELQVLDHEYCVVCDLKFRPIQEKWQELSFERTKIFLDFFRKQNCEKVILSPLEELFFLDQEEQKDLIFPLFTQYLLGECFQKSLVWKLWLLGNFNDREAQNFFQNLAKKYFLSSAQSAIKKFQFPFAYWFREVPVWRYPFSKKILSQFVVNKQMKLDLRYFKDADVDTIIPLNYGFFHEEKTILRFFNAHRCKFHSLKSLCLPLWGLPKTNYAVELFVTADGHQIFEDKTLMYRLQRGKSIEILCKMIDF